MIVYLAACNAAQFKAAKVKNSVLLSYHYWKSSLNIYRISQMKDIKIFIDSGAFSAYNSGQKISLQEYINFIKSVNVSTYASLDVIFDPLATYNNTLEMMKQGLNPIPTFHMGTAIVHLKRLLSFDYIALGGMVANSNIDNWLRGVFSFLMKEKPQIKVHGFGLTDIDIVKNYPWFSVDSTSWHTIGRNGRVQLWNKATEKFYSLSDKEYKSQRGIYYSGNKLEHTADSESARDFQYFEDYLNKERDYTYLTKQTTLFDGEEN